MPWLELHGIVRGGRLDAVARVRFALSTAGACILSHQQFSNVSLCLHFELDAGRRAALAEALCTAGVDLAPRSAAALAAPAPSGEHQASLQLTFIHDEPDLSTPPPPVPG